MRNRIREAKTSDGVWDVKIGAGRLQEIELLAQAGALLEGSPGASVVEGLDGAVKHGLIEQDGAEKLAKAAALMSTVHTAVRLLSDKPLAQEPLGLAAQGFLLRTSGFSDLATLERQLKDSYALADAVLTAALKPFEQDEAPQ